MVMLLAASYLAAAAGGDEVPARAALGELPMTIGEWRGAPTPDFDNDVLEVLGVDDYITRVYSDAAAAPLPRARHQIGLYVGYYESQRQGDTIHSPMNCLPGAGWQPLEATSLPIDVGDGRRIDVNRVVVAKGESRQLVLYWYQGRGRVVASEYLSKAYLIWDAAARRRSDGALVRVISPMLRTEDAPAAERRATAFTQALFPHLHRFLPD